MLLMWSCCPAHPEPSHDSSLAVRLWFKAVAALQALKQLRVQPLGLLQRTPTVSSYSLREGRPQQQEQHSCETMRCASTHAAAASRAATEVTAAPEPGQVCVGPVCKHDNIY
jgi:hypothetical protein